MQVFCTYCSRNKKRDPGLLAAIDRYESPRIRQVYAAAIAIHLSFYILSGEYGILLPEAPIPWYDHPLQSHEAVILAERIASQLGGYGVSRLAYFTVPVTREPAVQPYLDAIAVGCQRAQIQLALIEL